MKRSEIKDKVFTAVADVFCVMESTLTSGTVIGEDIWCDETDFNEFVYELDVKLGVDISEELFLPVRILDVINTVERLLNDKQ